MEVTTVLALNDHHDRPIGTVVIFKLDGQTFAGFAQRNGNILTLLPIPDYFRSCWARMRLLKQDLLAQYRAQLVEVKPINTGRSNHV